MSTTRLTAPMAILCGGFIAGTVDVGVASIINGISPFIILQAIASGLQGRAAYAGGMLASSLGMLLQWLMSLLLAAIFVIASRRWAWLCRHWIRAGLLYGVGVYVVMNYIVLPLSAVWPKPQFSVSALIENLLAMLLFGLIVAYFARDPEDSKA